MILYFPPPTPKPKIGLTQEEQERLEERLRSTLGDTQAEQVLKIYRENGLTIDLSLLAPGMRPRLVPHDQFSSVQELLDPIWAAVPPERVRPYSYRRDWVMKNEATGRIIEDAGSRSTYAPLEGGRKRDLRPLHESESPLEQPSR